MTMLFAQSINRNVPDTSSAAIFYAAIAVCAALLFFSFVVLIVKRYRRCPSNRVLVIYGKAGGGKAEVSARRSNLRLAAHSRPRLFEPGTDSNRNPAPRRALGGKHPRERAERVHRGRRYDARGHAERGRAVARLEPEAN